MLSPEGVKKLCLAVLSTEECVFPRLGEVMLCTPVQGSGVVEGQGTKSTGPWGATQCPSRSLILSPLWPGPQRSGLSGLACLFPGAKCCGSNLTPSPPGAWSKLQHVEFVQIVLRKAFMGWGRREVVGRTESLPSSRDFQYSLA